MSDDDFAFDSVIPDKGKSKQKSFEVEAQSMSAQELESTMRKEAEYVSSIFGGDVSTLSGLSSLSADRLYEIHCLLTSTSFLSSFDPNHLLYDAMICASLYMALHF